MACFVTAALLALPLIGAPLLKAQGGSEIRLPDFQREELPNGAVLLVMPRRDVPLITLRAVIKGGLESDPAAQAGLAAATADLLRRGTGSHTAEEISEQLDFIGATYNTAVDRQGAYISMEFLAKDLDRALPLFTETILRPSFPQAEVIKELSQRIDQARALKDEPSQVLPFYFNAFFFGPQDPYGRPPRGDEVSLSRISRDAITEYHRRMYVGRNLILIAAGDFESAPMQKRLAEAFRAVDAGTAYRWASARPAPQPPRAQVLLVDKPDAAQTYFRIGHAGIHRTHPGRIPILLINTLFGGRFTSMLNDALRVESGLTYGASSLVNEDRLPGAILISTFTRTETTAQAIDMALNLLRQLREKGITADQLASAKAYVKGTFPPRQLETATQLAAVLGELELYNLGREEIDEFFPRIDAVSLEQANAAAGKHFGPGPLHFVLLGNAAEIRKPAARYAADIVEVPITKPGIAVAP